MKIYCVWGQRKEMYEGQHGPELLASCDEYTERENPQYFQDELAKYKEDSEFEFVKVLIIEVADESFDDVFYNAPSLKGEIKNIKGENNE